MLPVGPVVIIMCDGGADLTNQKAAQTVTNTMNRIVVKAAARPSPKVSVNRVRIRREPAVFVINPANMVKASLKDNLIRSVESRRVPPSGNLIRHHSNRLQPRLH